MCVCCGDFCYEVMTFETLKSKVPRSGIVWWCEILSGLNCLLHVVSALQ